MPLPQNRSGYTFEDYLAWEENDRTELIDGEAITMQAAPSRIHQEVSGAIYAQIHNYLEGKRCRVYAAPFAVRVLDDADTPDNASDTVVEPDISIVCDSSKLDEHGCKGAPDMIAEILSPSTARTDRLVKLNLYQRAGVREYWIVDPAEKSIQVFLLDGGHYRASEYYTGSDIAKVNVLQGCFVELERVFDQE
ncbi:MAG: Uma2 family endonuclease [Firmicutes bacterium]|nr:Uma2 family endonuclease [Bacillota bacterium]